PGHLRGQVALVAGATRGAGRGIARALGEAGTTVYCTGRSVTGRPSPYGRPETNREPAALTPAGGGHAMAVRVDHTVEAEVEALVTRIVKRHGRLDVHVNSIAGEERLMGQGIFLAGRRRARRPGIQTGAGVAHRDGQARGAAHDPEGAGGYPRSARGDTPW